MAAKQVARGSSYTSTVTLKGQVTIPKNIRKYLGVKEKSRVEFKIRDNGQVVISPARTFRDFYGTVEPLERPEDFKKMRKGIQEGIAKEVVNKS